MQPSLYLGIEISGGRQPFTYVALDSELHLHAVGRAGLDELLAFTSGLHTALAALNAPSRLSLRRFQAGDQSSAAARKGGLRLAEQQLQLPGLNLPRIPTSEDEGPLWMRRGFLLYRRLEEIGYQPFPADDAPLQWLETQAEAAYWVLLDRVPLPAGSFESRLQRQLVCYDLHLPVSDPMDFFEEITRFRIRHGTLPLEHILTGAELNAMIAAYAAWVVIKQPEKAYWLGTPEEGEIVLPEKPRQEIDTTSTERPSQE